MEVSVTGVVQAVGFRPFVYRRARVHGLGGSVRNTGDAGVEIVLEGPERDVAALLEDVHERPPPLSVVESVRIERREPIADGDGTPTDTSEFEIVASSDDGGGSGTIPPDTGVCDACLEEIRDPSSRYHAYWATSCVDCGPRYTVIESLPYDRPRTTMEPFPLCEACEEEYTDPANRRYHAQTIACPDCGPSLSLRGRNREELSTGTEALAETSERLAAGEIVAIRGIGGTHLACPATDPAVVDRLRERTGRPGKPFALMASSIDRIERFATVSASERELLEDVRRPIVALDAASNGANDGWLRAVAPGLHTVGVMLPYAGLHHLLLDRLEDPLVMTSANPPGRPMAITVDAIYDDLGGVFDAALVHDREIATRCDDSVFRVVDGDRRLLRRSRGWVPRPLPRRTDGPPMLALGAEFDNVIAVARDDEVLPSQHLGDVDGPETEAFLRETVDQLLDLSDTDPAVVACDMHPEFLTTKLAGSYASELGGSNADGAPIEVQHHHAHAAGLLAEHDSDRAVVVAADGTGYGPDGTVWGGEVLDVTAGSFERVGGLGTFRLPGGDAAVRHPGRILASLLEDEERIDDLLVDRTPLSESESLTVRQSVDAGVNASETTSTGRFLDSVSALLGVCTERRYQGEPAIRLEAIAAEGESVDLAHELAGNGSSVAGLVVPYGDRNGRPVIDTRTLMRRLDRLRATRSTPTVAATAQAALAEGLATIAREVAVDRGVDAVGFTGGVAYNEAITRRIRETIEPTDLRYLSHERVPPGDAGIAYGQAIVATDRSR